MKKIILALFLGSLLSVTTAAPVFANGWDGYPHLRGGIFNPFWPVAAALAIPAAIIGTVANIAVPEPGGYVYAEPPVPAYSGPASYYAPRVYYTPRAYYAPRVYAAPRGYYSSRAYYPARFYRTYGRGW